MNEIKLNSNFIVQSNRLVTFDKFILVLFAIFLTSGALKPENSMISKIPGNITILSMILLTIFIFYKLLLNIFTINIKILLIVIILFILFIFGCIMAPNTLMAQTKIYQIYSGCLIASLVPMFFEWNEELVIYFIKVIYIVALIGIINFLTTGTFSLFLLNQAQEIERAMLFGVNPIEFGRLAGTVFLVSVLFFMYSKNSRILYLYWIFSMFVGAYACVLSGSRGPLYSAVIAIIISLIIFRDSSKFTLNSMLIIFIVFLMAWFIFGNYIPKNIYDRLILVFGETGAGKSTELRLESYRVSLEYILRNPMGIGWSGFGSKINLFSGFEYQYPHNIFIEIFLESGWLAGVLFSILVVRAFLKIFYIHCIFSKLMIFALLTSCLLNAMVSGDIVVNRQLFSIIFIVFLYKNENTQRGDTL